MKYNSLVRIRPGIAASRLFQFFQFLKTRLIYTSFFAVLGSCVPSHVLADRHCLPSQDAFYAARYALQNNTLECPTAMEEAVEALESALEHANACGCGELASRMETLLEGARNGENDCRARTDDILEQTEQVEALVRGCH